VHSIKKFCVVRGAWPSYNAKVMRPSGRPPMLMSIQQVERAIVLRVRYELCTAVRALP
jgi:hypothetical protein